MGYFGTDYLYLFVILALFLGCVFVLGVICALLLNWLLQTSAIRYLLSSGIVSVVSFSFTAAFLGYMLRPLRWVNGEPQNLTTALWDYLAILSAIVAVVCLAGWQFAVRFRAKGG